MLKVEVKVILRTACFDHISIKIMHKINRERCELRKKCEEISVLGIKNHRSAAVRGGGGAGCPLPLEPLVYLTYCK